MNIPIELKELTLADRDFLCCSEHYHEVLALPNPTTPEPHIHDCYEIYLNISGDVSFLVEDRLYAVESGDIIISRPGEMHVCVVQSPCTYESYCFWFSPRRATPLSAFADGADIHNHIRFQESDRAQLKDMVRRLYQAEKGRCEMERTAWVYQLLAMLNHGPALEQVSIPAPLPEPMQQVLTYINNHFMELRTVEEIAGHFYISTATLNRWFHSHLRITPKTYLDTRRLSYSKQLLNQSLSVTDTCDAAGFPNCSRFIAVFKKAFGITPLQYQKQTARNG